MSSAIYFEYRFLPNDADYHWHHSLPNQSPKEISLSMGLHFGVWELYTHYELVCLKNRVWRGGRGRFFSLGFLSGLVFLLSLSNTYKMQTLFSSLRVYVHYTIPSTRPVFIELVLGWENGKHRNLLVSLHCLNHPKRSFFFRFFPCILVFMY